MDSSQEPWFQKFGWSDNPFKIRPDPENLVGFLDLRTKILSHVHSESPVLVTGPTGLGKSTLLHWLKNQKGATYLNFLDYDEKKFKKQISGLTTKLKKFFGSKHIVLLDEAHAMPLEFSEWLRGKYDKGEIDSMVLAAIDAELKNFSQAFVGRIGARKIEMRTVTQEEAFKIVRQRIFAHGKENPFTSNALKKIISFSNFHPRKILENCERCCIHASWEELRYIDEKFVKKILKKSKEPKIFERKEKQKEEKTKEPYPEKKLSPTQEKILGLLSQKNLTTKQIASELGVSRASASKQLSRLMLKSDEKLMKKKGVSFPLIEQKNDGRPVLYGLKE